MEDNGDPDYSGKEFFKFFLKKYFNKKIFLTVFLIAFGYFGFVNHVEPTELGIERNFLTGQYNAQKSGWHITMPWVLVANIDLRPVKVSVCSSGRGYSAKLVRFVPEYWKDFLQNEGFCYYWWSNRLSFNLGYSEESRGLKDILRGYAYGDKKYPFIEIVSEY